MKHLEEALKQQRGEQPRTGQLLFKSRTRLQLQKWTLDPDNMQESWQQSKQRMALVIEGQLRRKFECEKYLQQETFRQLIKDLTSLFAYSCTELEKLTKIDEILQSISDSFWGDLKNYLKQFQSLLDAKIRKLKKRGKRSQLIEFDRLVASTNQVKRKNEVYFINEEEKGVKYTAKQLKRQESKNEVSKKSFGTMNSGSNENESGGSAKNKSGSDSKSGESKALAVLLANIDAQQQRKSGKHKQKQKQKYEFTSILNATANVRHRNNISRIVISETVEQNQARALTERNGIEQQQDKDQAFIFHRPKHHKDKP